MILFPKPILSLFGKSFEEGATVLVIMDFVSLINVSTGMCGALLEMTGHTRIKLFNSVIKVSLAILLNFLLIPRWGIVGAAIAALAHEVVSDVLPLLQTWYLYKVLPYNRSLIKPLLSGLAMVGVWFGTARFFPADNYILIGVNVILLMAVYTGISLLLGFSPQERALFARARRRVPVLH
jgi:O-antigen/teichoic acid export membrane protein